MEYGKFGFTEPGDIQDAEVVSPEDDFEELQDVDPYKTLDYLKSTLDRMLPEDRELFMHALQNYYVEKGY